MKRLTAVILMSAMLLGLTACGSSGGSAAAETGSGTEDKPLLVENVDVGDFTVDVPAGWMGQLQQDIFADPDDNGDFPMKTDSYVLVKGGENDWDSLTKPSIYIYLYENSLADQAEMIVYWYDEAEEFSFTAENGDCIAYEARTEDLVEEGFMNIYDLVFIDAGNGKVFQLNIPVDVADIGGVSLEDEDVLAIINSLKTK
ncbi:MAG: hypothetical protein Q4B73_05250 [Lachnospiraceae bacterium]|nr:hypothetical protein [Lachnospiraceae bacterium]